MAIDFKFGMLLTGAEIGHLGGKLDHVATF